MKAMCLVCKTLLQRAKCGHWYCAACDKTEEVYCHSCTEKYG